MLGKGWLVLESWNTEETHPLSSSVASKFTLQSIGEPWSNSLAAIHPDLLWAAQGADPQERGQQAFVCPFNPPHLHLLSCEVADLKPKWV